MKRFWDKVDKRGPDECWEWTACRNKDGYGMFRLSGQTDCSHRIALSLHLGRPIVENAYVLHSCNNPPCCNPLHLREGTQQDNMDDRKQAGNQAHGQNHGQTFLTDEDVITARRLATGGIMIAELAYLADMSPSAMSMLVTGES